MKYLAAYAFYNVWRSKARTILLITLVSIGVTVLLLIAAAYQYLFYAAAGESLETNGDLWLVANEKQGEDTILFWDAYIPLKEKLLKTGWFESIRGETDISGLIGNGDRSAPCSGRAVEDGIIAGEEYTRAVIGKSLAAAMELSRGSFAVGFIEDCGLTMKIQDIITTEASLKDRFFIELSLNALLQREINPRITTIHFRFRNKAPFPGLNSVRNSPGYENILKTIAAFPELREFTRYGISENNTTVNKIVDVYRTNYKVIEAVIFLTIFLAFLNVVSLSVYERQQEWGTLRAMGTPAFSIRLLITIETLCIAFMALILSIAASAGISFVINATGGITFPPPPGSGNELHLGAIVSMKKVLQTGAVLIAGAGFTGMLCTLYIGKRSIVTLLAIRN
jgi:ABC-type lipoprotein release transport system permease subunit